MNKSDMILKKAELFERFSLFGRRSDFLKKIAQDVNEANVSNLTSNEIKTIQEYITNLYNKNLDIRTKINDRISRLRQGQTGSWVESDADGVLGPRTRVAIDAIYPGNKNYRDVFSKITAEAKLSNSQTDETKLPSSQTDRNQDIKKRLKDVQQKVAIWGQNMSTNIGKYNISDKQALSEYLAQTLGHNFLWLNYEYNKGRLPKEDYDEFKKILDYISSIDKTLYKK
jgi:hypothetical protein